MNVHYLCLAFISLLLTSCGEEICVGPFGNCDRTSSGTTTQTSGKLEIYTTASSVAPGGQLTFKAKGGIPPYRFRVTQGKGQVDANTGIYLAPLETGATEVIEVQDSIGQQRRISILVETI